MIIITHGACYNNMHMKHNWNEYFLYDEVTGKLYWKEARGKMRKGSHAGCPDAYGYLLVGLNNGLHKAHRIIWEMHNGAIPDGFVIDHINQIKDDNRLENLRIASKSSNALNSKVRRDSSSGCCGVSWKKDKKKYLAYININGKRRFIGYYDEIEEAKKARKAAELAYGLHENHGQ